MRSQHDHHNPIPHCHHHHHAIASIPEIATSVLTIRPYSGLSGDILLTGLAVLCMKEAKLEPDSSQGMQWLGNELGKIMPDLAGVVKIAPKMLAGIAGWHAYVDLPEEHSHRNLADMEEIIARSALSSAAKELASSCFNLLAQCEAQAHGKAVEEVHFHEVGALDSILDICGTALFYELLGSPHIVCGALPMADGSVSCQHGILPAPAPAVLALLKDMVVCPFAGKGETLTPTAAVLLKALRVEFGPWPQMQVAETALVYGGKIFPGVSNGVAFALGTGRAVSEQD